MPGTAIAARDPELGSDESTFLPLDRARDPNAIALPPEGLVFPGAANFGESQATRAAAVGRDMPQRQQPTPLEVELALHSGTAGRQFANPCEVLQSRADIAARSLHTRIDSEFSNHDGNRDHGDMFLVSGAGQPSHPGHAHADHNVSRADALTATATARDAIMEAATGDDALVAPAAPSSPAPALPTVSSDAEQTAALEAPFTPQPAPVVSTELPPAGLAAPISLDQPADMGFAGDFPAMDSVMEHHARAAAPEQRLSAFARLRFRDGSYYMHTYQIILGRNVELAHRDMARLHKAQKLRDAGDIQGADAVLRGKKRKRRGPARSVVSASGGIVNAPAASLPPEYQQRHQSLASHSVSSSSHPQSASVQDGSPEHAPQEVLMQTFDEVPEHLDNYVPEDPNDCPLVPIHPQHIEETSGVRGPKGISREHAKIFYNFDRGGFDLEVLSRNGLWHEGEYFGLGKTVELEHGDQILVGMVEIRFFLPDVALTEEQRARQESTSRPMSFSFENGQGELESEEELDESASEDVSVNPRHVFHMPSSEHDSSDDVLGEEDDEEEDEIPSTPEQRPKKKKQTVKIKLKKKAPPAPPVKDVKRGYKRKAVRESSPPEPPPKKSKQKAKEAQKELPREKSKAPAKEPAKEPSKEAPQDKQEASKTPKSASPVQYKKPAPAPMELRPDDEEIEYDGIITAELVQRHNLSEALIGQPLEKRKGPGRPPKDGIMSKRQRSQLLKLGKEMERAKAAGEEPPPVSLALSKPKPSRPRKDSNLGEGEEEDVKESIERGDGEANSLGGKLPKPSKPAREPSPPMRIEDYTEEQLQRPSANYVVLIHEAISSSKTGQMNLQQIYSYIERHYPWYKFKTTTSGWQSSVRHNLGQHEAFMKGDKEGKGYNWKINPNVSIEKERRKRQVSPPQVNQAQRQGYYPPNSGYPAPYGQPGGSYYPGMPPQGPPPNGVPQPPVHSAGPRLPPSLARSAPSAAAPASQAAPNPSPYASPWAGGNPAASPPTNNPPRPYPQPHSQTPPVSSAPTYGVLYPTPASGPQAPHNGYAAASPYANSTPAPGASPYASTPGRPYTPYATAGPPPQNAPQAPNAASSQPAQRVNQPLSGLGGSQASHTSGRYPAGTNSSLVSQLEAFRDAYLRSMPHSEKAVDAAIQAFIHHDQQAELGDTEKHLLKALRSIPSIQALDPAQQASSIPAEPAVKVETNGHDVPATQPDPAANAELVHSHVASTAAAIAASEAAVEAATAIPSGPPQSSAAPPPENSGTAVPSTSTVPSQAQAFAPNMTGPSPIRTQATRPSVEPLTPVPGSPAVPNAHSAKKDVAEKPAPEDAVGGAKEQARVKPDADASAQAATSAEASPPNE